MTLDGWAAAPVETPRPLPVPPEVLAAEACTDPDCARCSNQGPGAVTEAGARRLLELVGQNYDAQTQHTREHYRHIAGEVFSAMSDALIATHIVHPRTEQDPDVDRH